MAAAQIQPETISLRWNRPDQSRLLYALVISLLLHALIWGIYKLETRYHILEAFELPRRLHLVKPRMVDPLQVAKKIEEEARRETPITIVNVNVNPDVATDDAPKNTQFLSFANSRAANPKADKDTQIPKIEGAEYKDPSTKSVPISASKPMQPAVAARPDVIPQNQAPPAPRPPDTQPDVKTVTEQKPKPAPPAGDLTLGKPAKPEEVKPAPTAQGTEPKSRPRTLADARARLAQAGRLAGEQVKQDGGTRRQALTASFDVKATPFGTYNASIIYAIQNRWYYILDSGGFARDRSGKVVIEFKLHYDGRVTDLKVLENSVDELLCLLCQKAILDPAPYERWPADLRRLVETDFYFWIFTFYF